MRNGYNIFSIVLDTCKQLVNWSSYYYTVSSIYNSFPTPCHLPDSFSNLGHFLVFSRSHLFSKPSTNFILSFSCVCWELWRKLYWYWLLVQDTELSFSKIFSWMTDDEKRKKTTAGVADAPPHIPPVLPSLLAAMADSFIMPTDTATWAEVLHGSWEGPQQRGVTSPITVSHSLTCTLLALLPSLSHSLRPHLITFQINYVYQSPCLSVWFLWNPNKTGPIVTESILHAKYHVRHSTFFIFFHILNILWGWVLLYPFF